MNRPTQRSEINVTPLVDVCLVLLVIFMIVTPLLTQGAPVDLPQTSNPLALPQREAQLTLVLDEHGTLSIGDERWARGTFDEMLPARLAGRSRSDVVLRADGSLPFREVREVLRLASVAKLDGLGLVTKRRADTP
jgi:biopolymer transport protein ExbD